MIVDRLCIAMVNKTKGLPKNLQKNNKIRTFLGLIDISSTLLSSPHWAMLELLERRLTTQMLGSPKGSCKNDCGLMLRVSPPPNVVACFLLRIDLWACEGLVAGRINRYVPIQNELSLTNLDGGQLLRVTLVTTSSFWYTPISN